LPVRAILTSDVLDLGNTVRVTENDTDLRRSGTLTGELGDLLDDLLGGGLQPRRGGSRVGESGGRNALSLAVKTAHLVGLAW
jgi:hypothetical protein